MRCRKCGGKVTVVESAQTPEEDGVKIHRIRKCMSCNEKYTSYESIRGVDIDQGYIHGTSQR